LGGESEWHLAEPRLKERPPGRAADESDRMGRKPGHGSRIPDHKRRKRANCSPGSFRFGDLPPISGSQREAKAGFGTGTGLSDLFRMNP
jgi:hypothetical protein